MEEFPDSELSELALALPETSLIDWSAKAAIIRSSSGLWKSGLICRLIMYSNSGNFCVMHI